MPSRQAPGELERLRAFVNTWDVETGVDELGTPGALHDWLAAQDLLGAGEARVARPALTRAVELREALRAVLLAHHGEPADPDAVAVVEAAARRAKLSVRF